MPACGLETMAAPVAASSNGRHVEEPGTVACERRVTLRFTRAAEMARAKRLNGTSEPLPHGGGEAREGRQGDGEDDYRLRPFAFDQALEVTAPARRDDAPDRLSREPVERSVVGSVLGAAEVPVAPQAREPVAQG